MWTNLRGWWNFLQSLVTQNQWYETLIQTETLTHRHRLEGFVSSCRFSDCRREPAVTVTTWRSPDATLWSVSDNWLLTPLGHLVLLSVGRKTTSLLTRNYMHKIIACFFLKFLRTSVLFMGPLILLFWTSACIRNGFQSQGASLTCVLPFLYAMDSSDLPLVQHLLNSVCPVLHLFWSTCLCTH